MGLLHKVEKSCAAAPFFIKRARKVRNILMEERGKKAKSGE